MTDENFLHFRISVILVLKQLRKLKDVSQADVNTDLQEMTGSAHNMGRNELEGNITMETLYTYCTYFNVSAVQFFQMVSEITLQDVKIFLEEREEERKRKEERKKKEL